MLYPGLGLAVNPTMLDSSDLSWKTDEYLEKGIPAGTEVTFMQAGRMVVLKPATTI